MQKQFDKILAGLPCSENAEALPLLLAVSGGVDSMVMATLFLNSSLRPKFAVAHCNFSLRGDESDADEALVSRWADENCVRIHTIRFDTEAYAREKGVSIEMAARDLRYTWFAALCDEYGYAATSLAHNANDNAETLMLNLLRGTGVTGIAGMSLSDALPIEGSSHRIVRPLLDFTRDQIEGFAYANAVPYRQDSTNLQTEYRRNKLRNLVFPVFEQINPSFIKTINREIGYFSQMKSIADDWYRRQSAGFDPENIDIAGLKRIENWEYLLYRLLSPYGFTSSTLASVQKLLDSQQHTLAGKLFFSEDHVLHTTSSRLIVQPRRTTSLAEPVMVIRGAGTYHFNGSVIEVEVLDDVTGFDVRQPKGVVAFDADRLKFPFVARRWEAGDWFRPLGLRGKKKVSDFFTDLKYSRPQKDESVVFVRPGDEPGHIMAVLGERIDEAIKVTPSTSVIILCRRCKA